KDVFDSLFEAEGSEIYLKNASDYIDLNDTVNFYTIMESAAMKNETAIGYRIMEHSYNSSANYGIVVNPQKSNLMNFSENDKIIVLSED
ncbi:MAG: potassium transporter TrkA, partial [Bacteroidota bacterium]|nr:potassium transporter TrkA [Bacteroidota bacterium]